MRYQAAPRADFTENVKVERYLTAQPIGKGNWAPRHQLMRPQVPVQTGLKQPRRLKGLIALLTEAHKLLLARRRPQMNVMELLIAQVAAIEQGPATWPVIVSRKNLKLIREMIKA